VDGILGSNPKDLGYGVWLKSCVGAWGGKGFSVSSPRDLLQSAFYP